MAHAQTLRMEGCDPAQRVRAVPRVGGRGYRVYGRVKTAVEWMAALVLLIGAVPLLCVLALLLVGTSRGPVLYSQMRLGRNGRLFRLYKLRTMPDGCEAATGPVWSVKRDPRATRIGRYLRATHLDELPQLWNVLRGEMALMGPRPERPEIAEQIERALPEFRHRLMVRPGLTGLAQILQPADSNLDTVCLKLAHDLEYMRRLGPWVDLRLAAATALLSTGLGLRVGQALVAGLGATEPIRAVDMAPKLRLTAPRMPVPLAPMPTELSKAA